MTPRHTEGATEAEREAFEAWARAKFHSGDIALDEFGGHSGENVAGAWDGWQARAALSGWISVDERLPAIGEAALVYTPTQPEDWPDTVRISIDHISPDYEYWNDHAESYEHWCCVGKPEGSVGPKEKAPYTHWMPLPTPPAPNQGAAS